MEAAVTDEITRVTGSALPIQRLAGWGLRGIAILAALGGLLGSVVFWALARATQELPWPLVSLVLLQILFAAAVVAWVALLWLRARQMGRLRSRDYPAITCVAACTRLMGELLAVVFVLFSLALSVVSLTAVEPFAGTVMTALDLEAELVEPVGWALAIATAIMWPVVGLFAAGMVLFGAYLFAEALAAMLEYVRDVRRIREALSRGTGARAGNSGS